MARLIAGIGSSHIPAIGGAIHKGLQQDPYWKPFFDGFPPIREWLDRVKPDVVVIFYNDHGLNFFLDKMPTFAVGAAPQYHNADEGWGIPTLPPFNGEWNLSWHIINTLVETEFDIVSCQDTAFEAALAARRLSGDGGAGLHQHGAIPATQSQPRLCHGQGGRRGDCGVGQQQDCGRSGVRWPVAPTRW